MDGARNIWHDGQITVAERKYVKGFAIQANVKQLLDHVLTTKIVIASVSESIQLI